MSFMRLSVQRKWKRGEERPKLVCHWIFYPGKTNDDLRHGSFNDTPFGNPLRHLASPILLSSYHVGSHLDLHGLSQTHKISSSRPRLPPSSQSPRSGVEMPIRTIPLLEHHSKLNEAANCGSLLPRARSTLRDYSSDVLPRTKLPHLVLLLRLFLVRAPRLSSWTPSRVNGTVSKPLPLCIVVVVKQVGKDRHQLLFHAEPSLVPWQLQAKTLQCSSKYAVPYIYRTGYKSLGDVPIPIKSHPQSFVACTTNLSIQRTAIWLMECHWRMVYQQTYSPGLLNNTSKVLVTMSLLIVTWNRLQYESHFIDELRIRVQRTGPLLPTLRYVVPEILLAVLLILEGFKAGGAVGASMAIALFAVLLLLGLNFSTKQRIEKVIESEATGDQAGKV
ncbi:hypothetical protein DL96DRAFT_1711512 [Flagelloscypha sp. PMI_526]|nr:hypothetical protein DL96DRAFT_1711512 [Flagelloscypha sp. PMI_526]